VASCSEVVYSVLITWPVRSIRNSTYAIVEGIFFFFFAEPGESEFECVDHAIKVQASVHCVT
jgi:hypothetical protein